jgi:hypothetical protein
MMNDKDRLQLQQMLKANDFEDQTDKIRTLKHSALIKMDVSKLAKICFVHKELKKNNPSNYNEMCIKECPFLHKNYTDIFNKVKNDEMNLAILGKFLEILGQIENDEIDQNEGSYAIGMLLKKMYIDSALKKADTINKEHEPEEPKKAVADISWRTFKNINN